MKKPEIWFKENAINALAQRLPLDCQYIAWVDADVRFARDDWADETVHQLQHYDVVQMWSQYQDVTSEFELIGTANSFMDRYVKNGCRLKCHHGEPYYMRKGYPGAPGLAWACTRKAWDKLGGLLDVCILGAGDWYMAHGFVGELNEKIVSKKNHPRYNQRILQWGEAAKALRRNVGVVPGLAQHFFHGPKVNRRYKTREQILIDCQYNPDADLRRDVQGIDQLTTRSHELRDFVRTYFHERNEDQL